MSDWMAYVYMQKTMPTNATGVEVTIDVLDSNATTSRSVKQQAMQKASTASNGNLTSKVSTQLLQLSKVPSLIGPHMLKPPLL
jgi:hypothetical protein